MTLTRANGTVTADWPAVSGATKYHVTYSTNNGGSWHAPVNNHTNWTSSSITFNADNAKTYVVGVRAGNDHDQWSSWRNSPASGPYTPVPPGPVASVTVTRTDGKLAASWPAVGAATHYHVTYTVNGSGNWLLAALNHTGSSIDISGVDNAKTYVVGVRAGNDAGWSGWRNSPASGPYTPPQLPPAAPAGLTATAGDQRVALAWNDPADSSITGYEYQVNHNDTATGNLSGWGSWQSIANSGADTTAHTLTGLTNGKEYRYKLRAVNAGGVGAIAPNAHPWYVAATPQKPTPPSAPSGLSVTPGDGYLDISWDAVSDATGYDVRAKTAGASDWHDVAGNITATSHRYTTNATIDIDYVAVRARNAGGAGPWSELSRAPAHDWRDTFIPSGASGQSVQPQAQLTAPTWGTITRTNGPVHKLHLNWNGVSGATGYNLACTDLRGTSNSSGWTWHICGWVQNDGTVYYGSVPSSQTRPVTVTRYQRESANGGGDFALADRSYDVRIRAVNDNSADASPWTHQTNAIHAVHGKLTGLSATRGNGSITLTWAPNAFTTAYDINCAVAVAGQAPAYTRCATLTGQDDTATSHTVTISQSATSYTIDNTKTYLIQIVSKNTWGQARAFAPPVPPATLRASSVSQTGATLTLSGYSPSSWYLKRTTPADTNCKSKSTATETLSTLTSGTSYTYTAYGDSGCANELASVTFTPSASVSNLSATSDGTGVTVYAGRSVATGFTTGSSSAGYTLHGVTVKFKGVGATVVDTLTVAVHAASGGSPAASATYTLSGNRPTGAGEYAYTCSACTLSASTTYFLVLSGGHSDDRRNYTWDTTASGSQTNTPSSFGWSIADKAKVKTGASWSDPTETYTGIFKVSATAKPLPSLSVTNIGATSATLNIANHNENWYYKRVQPANTACNTVSGSTTKALSTLTADTLYGYTAYSDSSCTTALDTVYFSTTDVGVGNLAASSTVSCTVGLIPPGSNNVRCAIPFTTGDHSDGYTLTGVTGKFGDKAGTSTNAKNNLDSITVAIHAADTGNSSNPAATAHATLSGSDPDTAGLYTYTCTASQSNDCDLAASTTYFVVASTAEATDQAWYTFATTTSDSEAKHPATNGWSIANVGRDKSGSSAWADMTSSRTGVLHIAANEKPVSVGNLTETGTGNLTIGRHTSNTYVEKWATAFTTGSNTGGYTVQSVIAKFGAKNGSPGNITAKIYADSSGVPGTAVANLTLTGPTAPSSEDATYVCSGSGCSLSASTTYHLSFEVAGSPAAGVNYQWRAVTSDNETNTPTNAGWSIANGSSQWKSDTSSWTANANVYSALFKVTATVNAGAGSLTASSVTATGATLARSNGHANTLAVPGWRIERDAAGVLKVTAGTHPAPAAGSRTATARVAARAAAAPAPGSRDAGNDVTALAAAGNTAPDGVWADGATLWVVDADDRMLYAYDLAAKTRDPGKDVTLSRNARPLGLASDGATLWVSDYQDGTVYAYPVPGTLAAPGPDVALHADNASPSALWSDGATLWVAEDGDGRLYAYDLPDGARDPARDVTLHEDNASSGGLWSDGVTMWVSDPDDGKVYAYRLSDGRRESSKDYDVGGASVLVYGLWSDGWTTWIADDGSDRVLAHHAH